MKFIVSGPIRRLQLWFQCGSPQSVPNSSSKSRSSIKSITFMREMCFKSSSYSTNFPNILGGAIFITLSEDICSALTRKVNRNNIPVTTMSTRRRATLVKDLKMFLQKVQTVYHGQARIAYAQAILNLDDEIDNFSSKIILSDEANYHLCRKINKQK